MKLLLFLLIPVTITHAQLGPTSSPRVDSLRHQLALARNDTSRVMIMGTLCELYRSTDSAQFFGQQAIALARQINFRKGEIRAMGFLGRAYAESGNLPKGFQMQLAALQLAEANQMEAESARILNQMGNLHTYMDDFSKAIAYYKRSLAAYEKYQDKVGISTEKMQLGRAFEQLNQLDSALYYESQAYGEMLHRQKSSLLVNPLVYRNLADIHSRLGNHALAFQYSHKGLTLSKSLGFRLGYAYSLTDLGIFFKRLNQTDSSIYYAKRGLIEAQRISNKRLVLLASKLLSELYEPIDTKAAFRYYKLSTAVKDSLFGSGALQAIQQLLAQEQQRKIDSDAQKVAYQNQLKQYALFAILGAMLVIGFILYRSYIQQKRANTLLSRQKEEINQQHHKAEVALTNLRTTQAQLIQKEKMASLGELTAGIAHEIQNPLNFVNNFSEVSAELVGELKEELDRDNTNEAKAIADDLSQNLQKISLHGGRASSIVKGMLEHARTSTGERQPTDLNALAEEYLRLAYHGLKAKDKAFNCELVTDLAPHLSQVEVVPQELGRVLLNLFSNAFYAVQQKQKQQPTNYEPTVSLSTRQENGQIEIHIKDNGVGIPETVKPKVFQPFFTTKPTGEGTGLGLSLSYDIITKGHQGSLLVQSLEGKGTEFIIQLPTTIPNSQG